MRPCVQYRNKRRAKTLYTSKQDGCVNNSHDRLTRSRTSFSERLELSSIEISSIKEFYCVQRVGENMYRVENLDGYEELDPASQGKVRTAIEVGHVSDDDWKGDLEMNRPGKRGFRVKQPKKAKEEKPGHTSDEAIAEDDTNKHTSKENENEIKQEDLKSEEITEKPKSRKSKAAKREIKIKHEESEPVPARKEPVSKAKKRQKAKVPNLKQEEADAAGDMPQPNEKKRKRAVAKATEPDNAEAADTVDNEQPIKATKKRSKRAQNGDVASDADNSKAKRKSSRKARKPAVKEEEEEEVEEVVDNDARADGAENEIAEEEPIEPPPKKSRSTRKKAKK
ncbi:MAG: hypothetical protein Q9167_001644 [Letrouitia subvulpina]